MNEFMHYATLSAVVALPALGVGIGQGWLNGAALAAIDRQPSAYGTINRITILSLALSETAALLGIVLGVLMLVQGVTSITSLGFTGIICALGIPGFLVGIISSFPGRGALWAATRQPTFAPKIMQILPIAQTMIQTPIIFGFIIAILILNQLHVAYNLADPLRLCASGLVFGLGSIGPTIGLGLFGYAACAAPGVNRETFNHVRTFTFISQALIEAPILFCLIVSLALLLSSATSNTISEGLIFFGMAIAMGCSTIGAGVGSGRASAAACRYMAFDIHLYPALSKASILTQTLIDTSPIYGLLISLMLLLFR